MLYFLAENQITKLYRESLNGNTGRKTSYQISLFTSSENVYTVMIREDPGVLTDHHGLNIF